MDRADAEEIHKLALSAITNLTSIFQVNDKYDEYEEIKRGVGLSIGKIQMDILEVIYKRFPELDDLK
ncbi:MAG: hypothetical protein PSY14_05350 [bacterium]|nr:hypothetical protein [bacterium]